MSDIELLRQQIKLLNEERSRAIYEKGLAAEENKDLRENFAYDYWVGQEMMLTIKIANLIKEIDRRAKKVVKTTKVRSKKAQLPKIKELPKNKWL